MNQVIVSYLLGRIAKVADVNPSDVKASMLNGTLEIQRLTVRQELLQKLPLEMRIETIPYILIKIPSPTSSTPLKVKIMGVHVKIPIHALQNTSTSPSHIPDGAKLWESLTQEMLFNEDDLSALNSVESVEDDGPHSLPLRGRSGSHSTPPNSHPHPPPPHHHHHHRHDSVEDHGTRTPEHFSDHSPSSSSASGVSFLTNSDTEVESLLDEDADLASCMSEEDGSPSSVSSIGGSPVKAATGGAFGFLKDKLRRSAEWVMDRKIEVEVEETKLEIVVDERLGVSAMGSIRAASVVVDPPSQVREECIRPVHVSILDILFTTVCSQLKASLFRVEKIQATVSLVTLKETGKMIRLSTAVEVDQIQLALDDSNIGVVARCAAPVQQALSIPPYCWPHLALRTRSSWWPYVRASIQGKIIDIRRRYNFTTSHIRFYCNSRRRYLRLLDEVYKNRQIGNHAKDLEELEHDIRYPDVVYYLRWVVLRKYGIAGPRSSPQSLAAAAAAAAAAASPVKASATPALPPPPSHVPAASPVATKADFKGDPDQMVVTVHVDVHFVRVKLPLRSAVALCDIHVEQRKNEVALYIRDLAFERVGMNSSYAKSPDEPHLVSVELRTAGLHQETKVTLYPMYLDLSQPRVIETIRPLLETVAQESVMDAIEMLQSRSASNASTLSEQEDDKEEARVKKAEAAARFAASGKVSTLFFVVPSVSIKVDDFMLAIQNASVVVQNSAHVLYPQYAVSLDDFHVKCQDAYFIHPVRVRMGHDDNIYCSQTRIQLTQAIWSSIKASMKTSKTLIPEELTRLQHRRPKKVLRGPIITGPLVDNINVSALLGVNTAMWKKPRQAQTITIEELVVEFELLDLVASIGTLSATPMKCHHQGSHGGSRRGSRSSFSHVQSSSTTSPSTTNLTSLALPGAAAGVAVRSDGSSGEIAWGVTIQTLDLSLGREGRHCVVVHGGPSMQNEKKAALPFAPSSSDSKAVEEGTVRVCVEVLLLPSGQISAQLHNVTAKQLSPAFSSAFELASVSHLVAGVMGKNTALRVRDMVALEGVLVKDVLLAMHGEAVTYQDRPYIASTMQLVARIVDINLQRVGKFVPDPLISLAAHADSVFSSGEVVSQPAYNTFYSGFTNIMVSVDLKNCPVRLSDTAELRLSLDHLSYQSPVYEKRRIKQLLPSSMLPAGNPIIVYADVEHLATYVLLNHLQLRIECPEEVTRAGIEVHLKGVSCQFPIAKLEVWSRWVLAKPTVSLNVMVPVLELNVPVSLATSTTHLHGKGSDCSVVYSIAKVQLQDLLFEKNDPAAPAACTTTALPAASEGNSPKIHLMSSPTKAQTESASTFSADDSSLPLSAFKVSVGEFLLTADASHPIEVYRQFFLLAEHFPLIPNSFGHYTCIHEAVSHAEFIMEETGDIFLDQLESRSSEIMVIESCTFSSTATERHIVVADGTTVLFRRCTFHHQAEHFIRAAGNCAFFFCEKCTDVAVSKKPKPPPAESATKMEIQVKQSGVILQLCDRTSVRVYRQRIDVNLSLKPSLTFARVRLQGEHIEAVDDGLQTIISSKVGVELEVSFKSKKNALAVNTSVSLGEVNIPLLSHVLPKFSEIASIPMKMPPPRNYVVPAPPSIDKCNNFPLEQWKILVSFSVLPINVVLRNGCTVVKMNISNGYFWTTFEPLQRKVATLEGHLSLSHISLLEFTSRNIRPITSCPIDINILGELPDKKTGSMDVKMSLGELSLTTDQLRLLITLSQHCAELTTTAVRIVNHTGEKVEITLDGNKNVTLADGEIRLYTQYVALHQNEKTVTHIGDVMVEQVTKVEGAPALYGMEHAVSFSTYHVLLVDGQEFLMVRAVTHHFVQELHLYSMFHVKNETVYTVRFTSSGTPERSAQTFSIPPNSLSCIPCYMMDAKGLKMSVEWSGLESTADALWPQETAIEFMEAVHARSQAPTALQKELIFLRSDIAALQQEQKQKSEECRKIDENVADDVAVVGNRNVYVDVSFERSWGETLFLFVTPSQPEFRSELLFPVRVEVLNPRGDKVAELCLSPGNHCQVYNVNPAFPHEFRVRAVVADEEYVSKKNELSLSSSGIEQPLVLRHVKLPKQRFFELTAVWTEETGQRICGWTLRSSALCYVENRCQLSSGGVQVRLSESNTPAGCVPTSGLQVRSERGFQHPCGAYVPLKTAIQLQFPDAQVSESFELTSHDEGHVVECPAKGVTHAEAVSLFALLRPVKSAASSLCAMEILPPLVLRNEGTGHLRVRLEVYRRGDMASSSSGSGNHQNNKCVFSQVVDVPPQSEEVEVCNGGLGGVPYFLLASQDGGASYCNYFSFSWEGGEFSHSMESSLSPGTSWTGLLECGAATHRVIMAKSGPYDPAVMSVGPPQRLGFQLINLTYSDFLEAPSMTIRRAATPLFLLKHHEAQCAEATGAWDQEELLLTRTTGGATRYRIRVAQDCVSEIEPDVFVYTVVTQDITTVVVCPWHLNNGVIAEKATQLQSHFTVSVVISPLAFGIQHESALLLQLSVQGINFWVNSAASSLSMQSTLSGVAISTKWNRKNLYVIEPFEVNFSLRDAMSSVSALSLQSLRATVSPIIIVVSDYFLGQLLPIANSCANPTHVSFQALIQSNTVLSFFTLKSTVECPKRVYIESAAVAPIQLEVSWDRSAGPRDVLQRVLPWWATLIPSLHHATLSTPQVELHQVSRDSVALLVANIQTIYVKEVVKQIPQFLGTVGLFKKNTSILQHFASKIGGLLFGGDPATENNPVSGGTSALI